MPEMKQALTGCSPGTTVDDAIDLNLIAGGLSPGRQRKLYPVMDRPRFLPNRAMVSNNTKHTCYGSAVSDRVGR